MTSTSDGMQMGETGARSGTSLPRDFLDWQREARLSLVGAISAKGPGAIRAMPAHLAVVGTSGPDGSINLATKGIGLVPKPEKLDDFTSVFRSSIERCRGNEWESTFPERAKALLSVYSKVDNFDDARLGGLEIFEGVTFSNLRSDPKASILFSGEAPSFQSYQIDCLVEFVERGDQYYEYLLSARELFAHDCFHVSQAAYPHGFVFHVKNVREKTPFTRRNSGV